MCELDQSNGCCKAGELYGFHGAYGVDYTKEEQEDELDRVLEQAKRYNYSVCYLTLNQNQWDIRWLRQLIYQKGFRRVRSCPKAMTQGRDIVGDPANQIHFYVKVMFPVEAAGVQA